MTHKGIYNNLGEYIAKYETPDDGCDYFSISNIISQMEIKNPPVAYLGIDNNITITNQPQYDCENIDHFVSLMADEWDVNYSKFYFLWQYSYDETTWTDLPFTGSDFQFTDDFDGLTYFRVILAANENTLLQVAKNGTPDNCDKDYFITNTVSIECLKACEKPEFEVLSDQNKLICEDSEDVVEWKVRQTNQTKSIDIEWYEHGGILNRPTAFGMNGSKVMVGGEVEPEAVLPISLLKQYIREENQMNNSVLAQAIAEVLAGMNIVAENNIYLGNEKLVTLLTNMVIDKISGNMASYSLAKGLSV